MSYHLKQLNQVNSNLMEQRRVQQSEVKEFSQSATETDLIQVQDEEIILVRTGCGVVRYFLS